MHTVPLTPGVVACLEDIDYWKVRAEDVERLATIANGNLGIPVMRTGRMGALVGGKKNGGAPQKFGEEFRQLARQCKVIRGGHDRADLYAAAFFHRRFEAIHPLIDGNGRIGRLLLVAQLHRATAIPMLRLQERLLGSESDYRDITVRQPDDEQIARMLVIVQRMCEVAPLSLRSVPFPLAPSFRESDFAVRQVEQCRVQQSVAIAPPIFEMSKSALAVQRALTDSHE